MANKDKDKPTTPDTPKSKLSDLIPSKLFIKKLKKEMDEEFKEKVKKDPKERPVSQSVYKAFLSSVPKVDAEENYRNIWKTTFKRQ